MAEVVNARMQEAIAIALPLSGPINQYKKWWSAELTALDTEIAKAWRATRTANSHSNCKLEQRQMTNKWKSAI